MGRLSKKYNEINQIIDTTILKNVIINGEEVTRDVIMTRRETIIKNHIKNVCPIKEYTHKGENYFYTKLNPGSKNNSKKISARSLEDLKTKIVAYYLDIDYKYKTTVFDILELAVCDLTDQTALRHKQIFKKHFSDLKDVPIMKLNENHIRTALQAIIASGVKAKAFNNATSTLNKINDYCVYNHIECINIRQKIEEFRKCKLVGKKVFIKDFRRDSVLAFNENEAVTILKYAFANADYLNLAIAALITTGLRAGELLALTKYDIDLDKRELIVDKMEMAKTFEIVDSCKDHSERSVFLNSDAVKVFQMLLAIRNNDSSKSEFIFLNSNSNDGKMHLRALDNRIRKIQHILGLTGSTPERSAHDCRRTYASIQFLHGIDIKTLQAQLGHKSAQQTWDYVKDIVDSSTRLEKLENGCIL